MEIVVMVESATGVAERVVSGADYVAAKAEAFATLGEGERILWVKTDR